MNQITILGCGPSNGVPKAGYAEGPFWGDCDPNNPKNERMRASVYVEYQGVRLLVDTSPDLRMQLLRNNIYDFDAVLLTHIHADHTQGIDDLRPLVFNRQRPFPLYADKQTLTKLQQSLPYLFHKGEIASYPKILDAHLLSGTEIQIDNATVQWFEQIHGPGRSTGFRFGNMAYSTDFNYLDNKAIEALQGLELWVVDCLSRSPRHTHNHLSLALKWIELVKPKRAVFTHMDHDLDYETLKKELPPHIEPAYDGMVLEF
jgi:phosphoribosyl 1,2-cyclic phosphate phosphodiesterase